MAICAGLPHDRVMSSMIWIGIGAAVIAGAALWAFVQRAGHGKDVDLGTISGQWKAEQRMRERESDRP
jgi:hypothetical protein